MTIQEFFVKGPLPDFNFVLNESKKHWACYHNIKKEWTQAVALIARAYSIQPVEKAFFELTWKERTKKRDPDNIAFAKKFILDGLVVNGTLPKDGWGAVTGWTEYFFHVKEEEPGVLVRIRS